MAYRNLSSYSETDPNDHITVETYKVTASGITNGEDAHVVYDFGTNYWDELYIDFEVRLTEDTTNGDVLYGGACFSNTLDDANNWASGSIGTRIYSITTSPRIYLIITGGTNDYYDISKNTTYYCRLERNAGNNIVTLKIYSDSNYSVLLDTLTVTGAGTNKYRYHYALCSYNAGGAASIGGWFQNINMYLNPTPDVVGSSLGLLTPSIGLYDTRYKLRSRQRDTALTTRVRNT
jgi:hypothetical protein